MQRNQKISVVVIAFLVISTSYCVAFEERFQERSSSSISAFEPFLLPPPKSPTQIQPRQNENSQQINSETGNKTLSAQPVSGGVSEESRIKNSNSKPSLPEIPRPFRMCTDKETGRLNECLRGVFEDLKPRLALGIPEAGILGIDPLKIPYLTFEHGNGPVKIVSQFHNVEITGLSTFNKSDFWADVSKRRLDFDVAFPHLLLAGTYQLSGNLFFVPIAGVGNFWLNLGGVSSKGSGELSSFTTTTTNGTIHRRVILNKTLLELNVNSIKVHLTNLFNGDRLLGSVINNFLNENSQDIFEELRPQIASQVGEMLTMIANRALSSLPADFFDNLPVAIQPQNNGENRYAPQTKETT